ncbi:alpha/beta hydrolase [Luedemannella helvata]
MRLTGGAALVCALLAGCGSHAEPPKPTPTKTFSFARSAPEPHVRCLKFPESARKIVIPSTDGIELAGVEAGTGPRGLVLLHQSGADLCGWTPYVADLIAAGLHIVAIDFRCSGLSDCDPSLSGDPFYMSLDRAADAAAAVAYLRGAGATSVGVMGASLGAAVAVVTAGRFPDQVDAVVALSMFNASFNASGPTATDVRTPSDAAPRVRVPMLLAGAELDPDVLPPAEAKLFIAQSPARAKSKVVFRPDSGAHGWSMLGTLADTVQPEVLDFLAANLKA